MDGNGLNHKVGNFYMVETYLLHQITILLSFESRYLKS